MTVMFHRARLLAWGREVVFVSNVTLHHLLPGCYIIVLEALHYVIVFQSVILLGSG